MSSEEAEAPPPEQGDADADADAPEATPVQSDGEPLVDQDGSTKNVLVFADPTISIYEKSLCAKAAIYNLGLGFTFFAFSIAFAASADVTLTTHDWRGAAPHHWFVAYKTFRQTVLVILVGVIGSTFLQVNLDIVMSSLVANFGLMGLSFQDDVKHLFATSDASTIVKYLLVVAYDVVPLSVAVGGLIYSATQVKSPILEPDYKEFFLEYYLIGTQIGAAFMMLVSVTARIKNEFTRDVSGSSLYLLLLFSPFVSAALFLLLISTVLSYKDEPDVAAAIGTWRLWMSWVLLAAPMLVVCKVFQHRFPSLGGPAFMAGNYLMMLMLLLLIVVASGWLITNDLVGFPTSDFRNETLAISRKITMMNQHPNMTEFNSVMELNSYARPTGLGRAKDGLDSSFISTKSQAKHETSRQKMHERLYAVESDSSHNDGWSHQVEYATNDNDILWDLNANELNSSQNFYYYAAPATEAGKELPLNYFPPKSNGYPVCNLVPMGNVSHLGVLDLAQIEIASYQPTQEKVEEHLENNFYGENYTIEKVETLVNGFITVYFPKDKVRVLAIRGTSKSDDWLKNFGLVADIAVLQGVGYFVPILNFIPESSTRRLIALRNDLMDSTMDVWGPIVDYAKNLVESNKDDELVIVGHSLGGLLASIVTAHLKNLQTEDQLDKSIHFRAIVFSAPGIYYNRDAFGVKSLVDLQRTLINVIPDNDIIPLVDKQVGDTQRINCNRRNAMYCHQLYQTVCELWRGCGDPKGRDYRNVCGKFISAEQKAAMKASVERLRKQKEQTGKDIAGGGGTTFSFADVVPREVPSERHIRNREPPEPAGSEAFSGFTDQAKAADEEEGKEEKNTFRVDWKKKDKKNDKSMNLVDARRVGLVASEGMEQSAFRAP